METMAVDADDHGYGHHNCIWLDALHAVPTALSVRWAARRAELLE